MQMTGKIIGCYISPTMAIDSDVKLRTDQGRQIIINMPPEQVKELVKLYGLDDKEVGLIIGGAHDAINL
jgi:spore maturation protein CgeB